MNFTDSVLNNIYIKDVWTLFTGTAVAQIIGLAFYPVLTRLFLPEEFGVFYFFMTTASILSIITTGGYEKAFVIPESDNTARHLLWFSLMLSAGVTILCLIISLFLHQWGGVYFQTEHQQHILWLIPVYSFLFGLYRIFQNWSMREKKFNHVSTSNIIRSGSLSIFQTGFGIFQSGSIGLVLGGCLSQFIPGLFLIGKDKKAIEGINLKGVREASVQGKEYRRFPFYKMPSDLINEISVQLPLYVFKSLFSNLVVGLYSLPQKILNQPSKFIGQAVADVYYRKASELYNQDKDLSEITFSTFKTLFKIGIIPFAVTLFWGEDMFSFIFSKEWSASGKIAAYLSPWLLFVFAGSPISSVFIIKKRLGLSFYLNLLLLFFRIASLLIGSMIIKNFEVTVILFAGSGFLYWICLTFFSLHLSGVKILRSVLFTVIVIILVIIPLGLIKRFLL